MKGYVPTPPDLVDLMVRRLFQGLAPTPADTVIDPGAGSGAFVDGVLRWSRFHRRSPPRILAIESDPKWVAVLKDRYRGEASVRVIPRDFLTSEFEKARFILGNPPYVPITGISEAEREDYRSRFGPLAGGRVDLYLLFFARALQLLAAGGRLSFVTPEKFVYVATASPLRRLLSSMQVESIDFRPEDTFPGLTTYPVVSTVRRAAPGRPTRFLLRDGGRRSSSLPKDGSSWLPYVLGYSYRPKGPTLDDFAKRISAGIATGADRIFVVPSTSVEPSLRAFAYPTLSGRELRPARELPEPRRSMLVPYDREGRLRDPKQVEPLLEYLGTPERKDLLLKRTCVAKKGWYAFHDSVPLEDILRPKIMWKDIAEDPEFWVDRKGNIVPGHTVYYLVPRDPGSVDRIAEYLRSPEAKHWMRANCQRAANGFLRLQSEVMRKMPVPAGLKGKWQ